MIRLMERAGDRMLGVFLPKLTAKAYCNPIWFCEWCDGGRTRWVYRGTDCNLYPHPCATNECRP